MAVPGHDQRDWEFAQTYELPIKAVIAPTPHPNLLPQGAKELIVKRQILTTIIGLIAVIAPARSFAHTAHLTARQTGAIRKLIDNEMRTSHIPGASAAIGLGQNIVWSEGFGFADIENHVPAKPETAYRTASIGKAMTATAAMRLVEQGKLDLNAPIQKCCPAYPVKDAPITVRDLISHTSGIRHYEGPTAEAEGYITRHYDHVSDALEIFRNDPLVQKPGADFHYTTWGYVVLGCVIEGASGEEYRRFMQETIFQPTGMTATRDDDPRVILPNRAKGYVMEGGILKNARWADMSAKMAAGGFITTAPDLVRFMQAWMKGGLVSTETKALMLAPYVLPNKGGTVDNFGLGWYVDDYHGLKSALYGGSTAQVSGFIFFVPEKQVAVAFLFNLEDVPGSERSTLARDITDVVLGYSPAEPAAPAASSSAKPGTPTTK